MKWDRSILILHNCMSEVSKNMYWLKSKGMVAVDAMGEARVCHDLL